MTLAETKRFANAFLNDTKTIEFEIFSDRERKIIIDFYRSVIDQCDYIERVSNPNPVPREILND